MFYNDEVFIFIAYLFLYLLSPFEAVKKLRFSTLKTFSGK